MSYEETKYNQTISNNSEMLFTKVSIDLLQELIEIMGEWNGDESGLLEDRFNAAQELADHLVASNKLIEELR